MTTVEQRSLPFRVEAYPMDRNIITAHPNFVSAMELSLTLCKFESGKDAARKLSIDPGALSCKRDGNKPWAVDEVRRVMEAGQNLIPLSWLAAQYGHGLVMLETEAERRERDLLGALEAERVKVRVLTDALHGRVL